MTDKKATILPTVLLHHTAATGDHFDWLLAEPGNPEGLLRTFRVLVPTDEWAGLRAWDLELIQPHRRIYLTYEGPIPGGRGEVRRVDEGTFAAVAWSDERMELDVAMRGVRGRVELVKVSEKHWRGRVAGTGH